MTSRLDRPSPPVSFRTASAIAILVSRIVVTGLAVLAPLFVAASESVAPAAAAGAFSPPSSLAARLVENAHVELTWRCQAAVDGGYWVEFATPGESFLKLEPLPREKTAYRHVNVAPETTFLYRLVPYFGVASSAGSVTTGSADALALRREVEGPLPAEGSSSSAAKTFSLRDPKTLADAQPANVSVLLASPTTADIRWTDRAADEDAYLVEIAAQAEGPFAVCALLEPNATSFRKIRLPEKTTCHFRVRACFYGEPSNVATIHTGKTEPKLSPEL